MLRRFSLLPSMGLFALLSSFVIALAPEARAAPWSPSIPIEDALADGEIDGEDLVARGTVGRATIPTTPGGHAWISLLGFARRSSITQEREIGGFLVVGLPLEGFARPPLRTTIEPRHIVATAAGGAGQDGDTSEGGEAALALTPLLARHVVAAAWRASGLDHDDARLASIVSRARWSAILPEARLRAVRFEDARLSTDTGTDTARWRDSAGANVGFEGRLTWRLDRLLYADDEPAFERMRLERHGARARIAGKALDALFQWQRAWVELRSLPAESRGTRDEVDAAVRVLEAEATLDVLTAGWFTTWRSRRVRRVSVVVPERLPSDL